MPYKQCPNDRCGQMVEVNSMSDLITCLQQPDGTSRHTTRANPAPPPNADAPTVNE